MKPPNKKDLFHVYGEPITYDNPTLKDKKNELKIPNKAFTINILQPPHLTQYVHVPNPIPA